MTRKLWPVVLFLAGCTGASQTAAPDRTGVISPPSSSNAASASTAVVSPSGSLPPLEGMLPTHLGAVELHTFPVGVEIVDRLLQRLEVDFGQLEESYASDHGVRFVQTYALRIAGVSGSEMVQAWTAVAYPPDVGDVTSSEQDVARKAVTVVTSPSMAAQIGTFYAYSLGNALLVVQALDPQVAEEALEALP